MVFLYESEWRSVPGGEPMLFMTMDRDKKEEQQRYPEQGEDLRLIRAAADGDRDAFEALVRKYERFVYRTAYYAVGNTADAEDLTQEVFLKLWRGLSGFRGQSHLLTWLSRIARNACADHIRKKKEVKKYGIWEIWWTICTTRIKN